MIKSGHVELWTETFGDSQNPAILLIMGAGASGIFWPEMYCKELSQNGYFVIRYDHRDVGKSSLIDYQKHPYTLEDLSLDSIAVLDAYEIQKAHVIGLSMGGFVGQILAIQYPERLYSLVSMMSTVDQSALLAALSGTNTEGYSLPPPPSKVLMAWNDMKLASVQTKEDRILLNLKNWKLCAGAIGYNEQEFRELEEKNFERTKNFEAAFNHWPAMASWSNRTKDLKDVKISTLVIHGEHDVIFPLEHGIATSQAIPESTLIVISGMGHAICNTFVNQVCYYILEHLKKNNPS